MPVGIGERKCEKSSGYNSIILGIRVNYYGRIMWIFCTLLVSGAAVYLVYLLVGVCLALVVLNVLFIYVYF